MVKFAMFQEFLYTQKIKLGVNLNGKNILFIVLVNEDSLVFDQHFVNYFIACCFESNFNTNSRHRIAYKDVIIYQNPYSEFQYSDLTSYDNI
jgi:hypothetical protein